MGGGQAAGGAADLPGSMWESARAGPVPPSLPGWVLASPRGYWTTCSLARSLSPPWGAGLCRSTGGCPGGVVGLPLALGGLLSLPGDGKNTRHLGEVSLRVGDPPWVVWQQGDTSCCHRKALWHVQVGLSPACPQLGGHRGAGAPGYPQVPASRISIMKPSQCPKPPAASESGVLRPSPPGAEILSFCPRVSSVPSPGCCF